MVWIAGRHPDPVHLARAGALAVVLCAGFACPDSHWRYLVPAPRRRGRCWSGTTAGSGASGLPRPSGFRTIWLRREDFRLDRYAEDLEAVLDHARVRRAVLLGHSMGTQVALEGYRRLPDRVAGLILVAGPYASLFHTMYGSDLGDRLFPLVRHGVPLVPAGAAAALGTAVAGPAPVPVAALLGSMGSGPLPRTWTATSSTWPASTCWCWSRWPRACTGTAADVCPTSVPALVVAGGRDPGRRPPWPGRWPRPSHAELHVLGEASHSLPIEEPERLEALVLGWLAERFPPRGGRGPAAQSGATG